MLTRFINEQERKDTRMRAYIAAITTGLDPLRALDLTYVTAHLTKVLDAVHTEHNKLKTTMKSVLADRLETSAADYLQHQIMLAYYEALIVFATTVRKRVLAALFDGIKQKKKLNPNAKEFVPKNSSLSTVKPVQANVSALTVSTNVESDKQCLIGEQEERVRQYSVEVVAIEEVNKVVIPEYNDARSYARSRRKFIIAQERLAQMCLEAESEELPSREGHKCGDLHEILQRDLRIIYKEDDILKYVCSRSSRQRLDMTFAKLNSEADVSGATHFIFQVNSEMLTTPYRRTLQVAHTNSYCETEIETLCLMLFKIKSELFFSSDRVIEVREQPIDLKFGELVALSLIRKALHTSPRQLRGAGNTSWECITMVDVLTMVNEFPVKARRFRVLMTDITGNCDGASLVVSINNVQTLNEIVLFGKKTHRWFNYDAGTVVEAQITISLYDSGKYGNRLRIQIDVQKQ